jgi:hypothetical protein
MSEMLFRPIFGAKIYVAPEGRTVEAVVSSASTAPAGAVLTDWEELACVERGTINPSPEGGTDAYCFDSEALVWQLKGVRGRTYKLVGEIVPQELTEYLLAMQLRADVVDDIDGSFVPNSKSGEYRGWVLMDVYVEGFQKILRLKSWAELAVTSGAQAERGNGATTTLRIDFLGAAGNAGTMTLEPVS